MAKVNFTIHFDSLFWPFEKRPGVPDPSYFKIADRFFELSEKHGFKYTIFIIGKDLENPAIGEKVRSWHEAGHEIANHSYSHDINLGTLKKEKIKDEIMKSHELIYRAIGKEPKGFISPGWSTSEDLFEILSEAGYLYDTSVFPSYFMVPMLAKLRLLNKKNKNYQPSNDNFRKSFSCFLEPKKPFKKNNINIMPLPVTPILQIPCWHTASFIFGKEFFSKVLKKCLASHENFYYVMHPADLAEIGDLPEEMRNGAQVFERINIPLPVKNEHLKSAMDIIINSNREIVTMERMAKEICPVRQL